MGYESKVLIGNANDLSGGTFVHEIAVFDLCKMPYTGPWARLLSASKAERVDNRDLYTFAFGDGDTEVRRDRYDDLLLPLDLDDVIGALEESDQDYRRIPPALGLLRAFRGVRDQYPDLIVLHYGH